MFNTLRLCLINEEVDTSQIDTEVLVTWEIQDQKLKVNLTILQKATMNI